VPIGEGSPRAEPENLTAENPGWDGSPHFSPDGRYIAYLSQGQAGHESDLFRIAVRDLANGSVRYLTSRDSFDNWASAIQWHPNGGALFFQADVKGRTPVFTVDLADGKIREILQDGAISGWKVDSSGQAVVYTRSKVGSPSEVFRAPVAGGEAFQVTDFNSNLRAEVDIRPAEEIWVARLRD